MKPAVSIAWEYCNQIEEHLAQDAPSTIVVHCRGGVGRAGHGRRRQLA